MHRDIFEVKADLERDATDWQFAGVPLTKGHKGSIIGNLNKYMGGDLRRQLALYWLFDREEWQGRMEMKSSKTLTEGQWQALNRWIDASHEPVRDEWLISQRFITEAKAVADVAEAQYYADNAVQLDPLFDEYPEAVKEAMKLGGVITDMFKDLEPDPKKRLTRYERVKKMERIRP